LHQVGDLFELNVKFRCQKVKRRYWNSLWWSLFIRCVTLLDFIRFSGFI